METVIAIGVLAVLLTGFMIVFAPAAAGIRKSISVQEADRLVSTLEQQLVTLRAEETEPLISTGFDKAFFRIKDSTGAISGNNDASDGSKALLVYQYRGSTSSYENGMPSPVANVDGKKAGEHYVLVPVMRQRQKDSSLISRELPAVEGSIYLVKCAQLVFKNNQLVLNDANRRGQIYNPRPNSTPPDPAYQAGPFDDPDLYPDAVIAFTAEFYTLPSKNTGFLTGAGFTNFYKRATKPIFSRNIAVRR